jgi:branched-subunit amino acid transport protein
MPYRPAVLVALLALAAGTFVFRFTGPVLRSRLTFPPQAERLLNTAAIVLLGALVASSALATGHHIGGVARPIGVLVGGVLAYRKVVNAFAQGQVRSMRMQRRRAWSARRAGRW